MDDKPEKENGQPSVEELITGIGKLVFKLNESVVSIDKRLEELEEKVPSLLEDSFRQLTSEVTRGNELLAELGETEANDESSKKEDEGEDVLLKGLEEIRDEVSGVRKDFSEAERKLLDTLEETAKNAVDKDMFTNSLSDTSVTVSDSVGSLEKKMEDLAEKSDEKRDKSISDNLKVISEGIDEISSKMDETEENIGEKLEEIRESTAEEVSAIDSGLKASAKEQEEKLEKMKELLSLHSVEVNDNRVRNFNRSAVIHYNNAEYGEAISALEQALELDPESSEILANIAYVEASQGKLDDAEEHFRKALETDPELEPALSGLGTVLVMSGRAEDSIDFLKKYLDGNTPPSTGILIALSRAYAAQDNHEKALSLLQRAEENAPGHPELEQELAKYRD